MARDDLWVARRFGDETACVDRVLVCGVSLRDGTHGTRLPVMERFRAFSWAVVVSMLLSSAGAFVPACASSVSEAASSAQHAHHQQVDRAASMDSSDCCDQCQTLCGAGCAAIAGPSVAAPAAVVRRDSLATGFIDRYRSPSPHSPFRPPIVL